MAAARRSELGGVRDVGFNTVPCLSLSSSVSYDGGGDDEDDDFSQALTDLCRMAFANTTDDQIDSLAVGSGRHWLTVDDSPIHPVAPQPLLLPQPQSHQRAFANTEPLLQHVGEAGGMMGGRRLVGGRDMGTSSSIYGGTEGGLVGGGGVLGPQTMVRDTGHVSNLPYYQHDAFDHTLGGAMCDDVLLSEVSGLSTGMNMMSATDESANLSRLGELHYALDIPLLSGDDDSTIRSNYLMLTDNLSSLTTSGSEATEKAHTNSQQVLGQLIMPQISSGCTVAAVTEQHDRSISNYYANESMQRISEASRTSNPARNVATGSRKVLKANRRLKEKNASQTATQNSVPKPMAEKTNQARMTRYVGKCLTDYGICVVDRYMGLVTGTNILEEVENLEAMGLFQEGQLICQTGDTQTIRGDRIMWVERDTDKLQHITVLIRQLDNLLESLNGQIVPYRVNSRSKAMVACYPGHGRGYMRHVDNATQDGRCITCIYYLNKDWNVKVHGGLLRMFPTRFPGPIDVEPMFDRLLLFWSDHRNPHEVQPAYRDRYAITVWYFDDNERQQARLRYMQQEMQEPHYGMDDGRLSPISLSCG